MVWCVNMFMLVVMMTRVSLELSYLAQDGRRWLAPRGEMGRAHTDKTRHAISGIFQVFVLIVILIIFTIFITKTNVVLSNHHLSVRRLSKPSCIMTQLKALVTHLQALLLCWCSVSRIYLSSFNVRLRCYILKHCNAKRLLHTAFKECGWWPSSRGVIRCCFALNGPVILFVRTDFQLLPCAVMW